jgi:hypothetical protein
MFRVRIAGPRLLLDRALTVLQDLGVLHVDRPRIQGGGPDRTVARMRRHAERCLRDVEAAIEYLHVRADTRTAAAPPTSPLEAVRRASRIRRRAGANARSQAALDDERALLLRYREFFLAFEGLARGELTWPDGQAFYVVLRAGASAPLRELKRRLEEAAGGEIEVLSRELSTGEWAVLMLASARAAPKVSALCPPRCGPWRRSGARSWSPKERG